MVPMPFPSTLNCTLAMEAVPLGVAEAETGIVPETVLPLAGLVSETARAEDCSVPNV